MVRVGVAGFYNTLPCCEARTRLKQYIAPCIPISTKGAATQPPCSMRWTPFCKSLPMIATGSARRTSYHISTCGSGEVESPLRDCLFFPVRKLERRHLTLVSITHIF